MIEEFKAMRDGEVRAICNVGDKLCDDEVLFSIDSHVSLMDGCGTVKDVFFSAGQQCKINDLVLCVEREECDISHRPLSRKL